LCLLGALVASIQNYTNGDTLKAIYWLLIAVIAKRWMDFQADIFVGVRKDQEGQSVWRRL
jgi:hypothetical protein